MLYDRFGNNIVFSSLYPQYSSVILIHMLHLSILNTGATKFCLSYLPTHHFEMLLSSRNSLHENSTQSSSFSF